MNVYRKSLLVQLMLFIVFIIMGGYTILEFYYRQDYHWMGYVLLGLFVLVAALSFYLFKRDDKTICVITQREMLTMRYLLYAYFLVYVLEMILPSIIKTINTEMLTLVAGILLILIALAGTIIQFLILKATKTKEGRTL
ncbi:MAG: hypothetical protein WC992_02390 [Acholeplasmataceae bacterium]|jgi:hypothetical protein|nr:hypothetical protein [Acholeplasmataceae bacterium]